MQGFRADSTEQENATTIDHLRGRAAALNWLWAADDGVGQQPIVQRLLSQHRRTAGVATWMASTGNPPITGFPIMAPISPRAENVHRYNPSVHIDDGGQQLEEARERQVNVWQRQWQRPQESPTTVASHSHLQTDLRQIMAPRHGTSAPESMNKERLLLDNNALRGLFQDRPWIQRAHPQLDGFSSQTDRALGTQSSDDRLQGLLTGAVGYGVDLGSAVEQGESSAGLMPSDVMQMTAYNSNQLDTRRLPQGAHNGTGTASSNNHHTPLLWQNLQSRHRADLLSTTHALQQEQPTAPLTAQQRLYPPQLRQCTAPPALPPRTFKPMQMVFREGRRTTSGSSFSTDTSDLSIPSSGGGSESSRNG